MNFWISSFPSIDLNINKMIFMLKNMLQYLLVLKINDEPINLYKMNQIKMKCII